MQSPDLRPGPFIFLALLVAGGEKRSSNNITKKLFAERLINQLTLGYDKERLADWAFNEYLQNCRELEPDKIMDIVLMEEGPQFEMTEDEVRRFCDELAALIARVSGYPVAIRSS